jgi:hypothetical protein
MQLDAGIRIATAASAAVGAFEAQEAVGTVGPPASAVVSLSMLTKTAPPPTRARRAKARSLRTEGGPQITRGHRRAAAVDSPMYAAARRVCARYSLRALTLWQSSLPSLPE